MRWEKIGVTLVCSPKAYGSGIYLRIPKETLEAYELGGAEKIEFEIKRVRRPSAAEEPAA